MCMSLPYSGQGKGLLNLLKQLPGFLWMLTTLLTRAIWLRVHRRMV